MTKDRLITAPAGTSLDAAEQIMGKHRIEKLPVVDDAGKLIGLITVKDIEKAAKHPNACKDDQGRLRVAAAICEAIENGPSEWRSIDVEIIPGVTAMLAVAARIGAPLGHDFCGISLSDNLKPWELIELRLLAAVIAPV